MSFKIDRAVKESPKTVDDIEKVLIDIIKNKIDFVFFFLVGVIKHGSNQY